MSKYFKYTFSSSTSTKSLIDKLKIEPFRYEPELVNILIMITISNGGRDKVICPFDETKENYNEIRERISLHFGGKITTKALVASNPTNSTKIKKEKGKISFHWYLFLRLIL